MTIRMLGTKPAAAPFVPTSIPLYAIHAAEAGTAILTYTRDAEDAIDVETIDRLPAGLDASAAWLHATFPAIPKVGNATITIDADGLGQALWDKLRVQYRRGWRLYDRMGRDRQELVNGLLVALSDRRVHIQPSRHEDALRKALAGYRRTVGEDGIIGGELVVALALAVYGRRIRLPQVF